MAASKRKQDEKHLKILREMVALQHNKHCFDCHQRGPTYVNMTVGTFVCTSCSGVLRGLNPPHRVKSISMTSFTPEEIEFLKFHGNDLNRKVWLGLFDSRSQSEPDSKEEQKIKDFMIQKYERKRWYVAPTEAMKDEAKRQNDTSANKKPETKPLRSLLGNSIPKFGVPQPQKSTDVPVFPQPPGPAQKTPAPQPISQPSLVNNQPAALPQLQKQESKASSAFDLLGDLGGDPFAAPAPQPQAAPPPPPQSSNDGGFANFESAFSSNFPPPQTVQTTSPFSSTPVSQETNTFGAFSSAAMPGTGNTMMSPSTASTPGQTAAPSVGTNAAGDRYAALADLDSVFGSSSGASVKWDGSSDGWSSGASASFRTTSATPASTLSGSSGFTSSAAQNPFSAGPPPAGFSQPQTSANPFLAGSQPSSGFPPFGASQPASSSSASFGQFTTTQAPTTATFGMQNGGFPSSGWGAAPANQQFGQTQSNMPFGQTQQQVQQPFGQTPNQPFAQTQGQMNAFPPQQAGANAGFGMQGMSGGAQFGKQGFGTQQQPFGSQQPQQQMSGGWGQPAQPSSNTSNPFMNIPTQQGIPPNSTNPFL